MPTPGLWGALLPPSSSLCERRKGGVSLAEARNGGLLPEDAFLPGPSLCLVGRGGGVCSAQQGPGPRWGGGGDIIGGYGMTRHPRHTPVLALCPFTKGRSGSWAAPGQLLEGLASPQVPTVMWATLFYSRGKIPRPFQTAGERRELRHPEHSGGISGQGGAHRQLEPLPVQVSGRVPWPPAPSSFTGLSSDGGTISCNGAVIKCREVGFKGRWWVAVGQRGWQASRAAFEW